MIIRSTHLTEQATLVLRPPTSFNACSVKCVDLTQGSRRIRGTRCLTTQNKKGVNRDDRSYLSASQLSFNDFMILTHSPNVAGFVMKEFAPISRL